MIFLPFLSQVVTFLSPPFTQCDVTYFSILHLEIIKLKQQNCDVSKFRIPSLATQCHTSSAPPSAPLTCYVIYGCPLIIFTSLDKIFTYLSIQQKLFGAMSTIFNAYCNYVELKKCKILQFIHIFSNTKIIVFNRQSFEISRY